MRKSLFLWTLLLSVACAVGCSKSPDSTDNTKKSENDDSEEDEEESSEEKTQSSMSLDE